MRIFFIALLLLVAFCLGAQEPAEPDGISYEYVHSLYLRADQAAASEQWDTLVQVLDWALLLHETYLQPDSDFARYANYLGLLYLESGFYEEAAPYFQRVIFAYDSSAISVNFHYANSCNNLAMLHYYEQEFEEAALFFEKANVVYRELSSTFSPNHVQLLANLASIYYEWEKPGRAAIAFRELETYLKRYSDENELNYILGVEKTADYYAETGQLRKAEQLYIKAIGLRAEADPYDLEEHGGCFLLLANLYADKGRPDLAAETALEAWDIFESEFSEGHEYLVFTLSLLGMNYYNAALYNTSLYYYEEARRQMELSPGPLFPEASTIYNNLGSLYYRQNRYREAIVCMERSLELHPEDPVTLSNMGLFSYEIGNPRQARDYYQEALKFYASDYGKENPFYATALIEYVRSRVSAGDFSDALIDEVREAEHIMLTSEMDTAGTDFIDCMRQYRVCYFLLKDYTKAREYGERAIRLAAQGPGRESLYYGNTSLEQAGILVRLDERDALAALYEELESIANVLDDDDGENLLYELELSRYSNWYHLEDYEQARRSLEWVSERDRSNFVEMQGILSAGERATFASTLTSLIDYNSFVMRFPGDPEVSARALNNRLFIKGILLRSEQEQLRLLESSGDSILLRIHEEYSGNRSMLSNLRSQFGVDRSILDSLEMESARLEKEIGRRLGEQDVQTERTATWEDIRDALEEDEAAVELVNFYYLTRGADIYLEPWYLAFIITSDMEEGPTCIPLYTSPDVYPAYLEYRKEVETGATGSLQGALYDLLWSDIDSVIGERNTLYFSPDLIFHQINIEALEDGEGRLLLDKYQIRQLNTLSELLEEKRSYGDNRTALLAGDPRFRMARTSVEGGFSEDQSTAEDEGTRGVSDFQARMFPGAWLSPLPGTLTEVDTIGSMLEAGGWECRTLTGTEATEDAIVSFSNPRILHLATHGFFAPKDIPTIDTLKAGDDLRSYSYMDSEVDARSCLFFAGAQNTLFFAYDYQKGRGDGILTAWEIEDMELDSTELVVLSACETGLGDMLNAEGVTGIRRAFHLAGADRLLLSLWEVDDSATQLLMQKFYSNWLSGMDMDCALVEAKRYLIHETPYAHPRYWSAFILTGI